METTPCSIYTHSSYTSRSPPDCEAELWIGDTLNDPYTSPERPKMPLPLEAPIQPRVYYTSSSTSRKEIPVRFAKQFNAVRNSGGRRTSHDGTSASRHWQGSGEHAPSQPLLEPHLLQQIKERRRRNAISARKSRQRRLEQMEELEKERNNLLNLVHGYRDHVLQLHAILQNRGIPFATPTFISTS
ncbi:hypothetical protein AX15_003389 [Amanita polypyramis BW_CC]|nr:hypothetical protein AX15_003389 [Amanita polypyramis BW_CC]